VNNLLFHFCHHEFERLGGLVARSGRPKQFTPPTHIVMLACLINFSSNAGPQELAGGNMSPMRKTAGQKAAATRKRNSAKRQAAAKKAASTRKWRAAGKKAAKTRTRRASARKAAATRVRKKEAALTQPVQVQEPPAPEPQVQATPETSIPE
jgi:hypothetical protein